MKYEVISADCHLDSDFLPGDTFTTRVPAAWRDAVPQVKDTPAGPTWFAGDVELGPSGPKRVEALLSMGRRGARMRAAGFAPEQMRAGNPALRIEDQDKDGVDAEVMYGPLRRWKYLSTLDAATAAVVAAAYNDYVAEFCAAYPGRLFAQGAVPPTDPGAMIDEIAHIAELRLAGAEVPMGDLDHPVWDTYWDPLWAAAVDHDVPIHIHVPGATSGMPGPDSKLIEHAVFYCGIPLALQPTLTAVVLSGMLERHPRLKVVLAETGSGWVPYLLDRIDYEWENFPEWREMVTTRPSELFRRQMYATFQEDAIGPQLAYLYPNNFLWGSDYPHADGIWPDSQEIIRKTMGMLDESLRRRIIRDNAMDLYHIGVRTPA